MNRKWLYVLLYPGRLPMEFADVERLTLYFTLSGMFISGLAFLSIDRPITWLIASVCSMYLGRLVGLVLHDRSIGPRQEATPRAIPIVGTALFVAVVAVTLVAVLYWAWTTRQRQFILEAIIGAATLTVPFDRGMTRVILGFADVALVLVSIGFCFFFSEWRYLVVGAYASFIAWALLIKFAPGESDSVF